uniref:Lipocalin/cytosolic fatty-acid binding domain-containing protein n=1 Tax=Timema monikensis TaxID=170555 RepID=A0A7R9E3Q7_9NEOP|nr:unnamed protein product [Timema monikensis]
MTMTTMLTLLVLTGTLSAVYAQLTVRGECPEVQVASDFNVSSEEHKNKENGVGIRYLRINVSVKTRKNTVSDDGNPIGQCERSVLCWFGNVERMSVELVTKRIYEGRVCGSKEGYAGVWYEQKRITFLMVGDGICVNATYTPQEDGTVEVLNQDYLLETKEHNQIKGSASLDSDSGEAKFLVKFGGIVTAPYWVLGTDYTSYSVVWSCLQAGSFNLEFSWLLTRDKNPSSETLKAIDDILIANNLQDLPYNDTPQTC